MLLSKIPSRPLKPYDRSRSYAKSGASTLDATHDRYISFSTLTDAPSARLKVSFARPPLKREVAMAHP